MKTSQIKTFAINSRQILKEGVINKISSLGFNSAGEPVFGLPQKIQGATVYAGKFFDESFYDAWMSLYQRIKAKGIKDVYEEAAYTWFNRLIAIRIMQKNNLIEPVLVYSSEETRIPRIVAQARSGHLMTEVKASDKAKLEELLNDDSKTNEQFALLIENFCKYNPVIYNCFGGIEKYISILLPDNILVQGGFIDLLNHTSYITDEDYTKSELIGWLYQFYIAEKKDEVFESFKKGKKAEAEDIPAATQIFTPNWIVKYMVQNTIGRIYLDNNSYSELGSEMKYLVNEETKDNSQLLHIDDLQSYRMIDPACGSGHILLEAFDLFYSMYREEGFSSRQAVEYILTKNIIGIDLDTRAKQLATFALLMKAVKTDESFFDCQIMPRVMNMPKPYHEWTDHLHDALTRFYLGESKIAIDETLEAFELLTQAENLGSIMKFNLSDSTRNQMIIRIHEWKEQNSSNKEILEIINSLELVLALSDKYTCVIANPPYMGAGNMNSNLSQYIKLHYDEGKADLATVFVQKIASLVYDNAFFSFIIPPSWMFLSSFERLRKNLLKERCIKSFIQLSNGAFGGDFGSTPCVFQSSKPTKESVGTYFKIVEKTFQFIESDDLSKIFLRSLETDSFKFKFSEYVKGGTINHSEGGKQVKYRNVNQFNFFKIPGVPIGFWIKNFHIFDNQTIEDCGFISGGRNKTHDNTKYIRFFWEVSSISNKWEKYANAGGTRKYSAYEWYVVDWSTEAQTSYSSHGGLLNPMFWNKEGITWNLFSSSDSAFSFKGKELLYSSGSPTIFNKQYCCDYYVLGFLNSVVARDFLRLFNPTINTTAGDVLSLPMIKRNENDIETLVLENYRISKSDWDSHETSWNYKTNELVRISNNHEGLIAVFIEKYRTEWESMFEQLHENEEVLNRKFIEIYGLHDDLTPNVPLDEITILQAGEITHVKDESEYGNGHYVWNYDNLIKQLISYAVGCWMGRYRLDKPGLHIAHPNPTSEEVCTYQYNGQDFEIDDDGIIPMMTCDSMFDDNGYNRIVSFIKTVFGEENLTENLNFIEKALGKSLEDYMVKDFWKDHKKMYQNRPIYWLFSSKKGAFQCLAYMHRMNPYTAERVRTKYLLRHIEDLKGRISLATERGALLTTAERKNLVKMQKDLDECLEYHDILHEVADQQINFDLDDGVVVNYAKFGEVLAKIK